MTKYSFKNNRWIIVVVALAGVNVRASRHTGHSKSARREEPAPRANPAVTIEVRLPSNRCQAGTIRFGGETCKALGRGTTVWTKPGSRTEVNCDGQRMVLKPSDFSSGRNRSGKACWFVKPEVDCGATPLGRYLLTTSTSTKSSWNRQSTLHMNALAPVPAVYRKRTHLLVHTDNRFEATPENRSIDAPTHSTWGCVKLDNECQTKAYQFVKNHPATQMIVRQK